MKKDIIPGGKAKGMSLNDIAKKHVGVNGDKNKILKMLDHLKSELKRGIKTELEHTTSKGVAKEIAMDHLLEDPNYYKKIQKMEKVIKLSESDLIKIIKKIITETVSGH